MPKHDAGCDADVQAVLCAVLRYLEAAVAHIDNLLLNAFHFVAKHDSILLARFPVEVLKHRTSLALLDGKDNITFFLKPLNSIFRLTEVAPLDTFLCSKCRLMYFWMRRLGCYAAQHDCLYAESIAAAKHTAHVVKTTYVVQHNHYRLLVRCLIFSHIHAAHFRNFQLSHNVFAKKVWTKIVFYVDNFVNKLVLIHNKTCFSKLHYPLFTLTKSYKTSINAKKASYQDSISRKIINFAYY